MFQAYKALVEKQNDKIIKMLCINNGRNILPLHLNHFILFKVYCTNLQYHTHLNKVVLLKKKKKTLIKVTQSMFHSPNNPFILGRSYLYIMLYSKLNSHICYQNTTPYEVWRHHKLTLAHLHVFKCPCYVQVPPHYPKRYLPQAPTIHLAPNTFILNPLKARNP
jgi:hypothetical protein